MIVVAMAYHQMGLLNLNSTHIQNTTVRKLTVEGGLKDLEKFYCLGPEIELQSNNAHIKKDFEQQMNNLQEAEKPVNNNGKNKLSLLKRGLQKKVGSETPTTPLSPQPLLLESKKVPQNFVSPIIEIQPLDDSELDDHPAKQNEDSGADTSSYSYDPNLVAVSNIERDMQNIQIDSVDELTSTPRTNTPSVTPSATPRVHL